MRYFILLLGVGFSISGPFWIVSAYRFIAKAKGSQKWPLASGIVTRSNVVLNDQSYLPEVEYRYDLNGQTYVGRSIHAGAGFAASETWAKSVVDRYPVGAQIRVAIDQTDPAVSVLEPGVRWHMYMYFCAGCIVTALGCALLYLTAIHWHDKSAQQGAQDGRAIESRAS